MKERGEGGCIRGRVREKGEKYKTHSITSSVLLARKLSQQYFLPSPRRLASSHPYNISM